MSTTEKKGLIPEESPSPIKEKKGIIRLIIVGIYFALLIAAIVLFCCKAYLACGILMFIKEAIILVDSLSTIKLNKD